MSEQRCEHVGRSRTLFREPVDRAARDVSSTRVLNDRPGNPQGRGKREKKSFVLVVV